MPCLLHDCGAPDDPDLLWTESTRVCDAFLTCLCQLCFVSAMMGGGLRRKRKEADTKEANWAESADVEGLDSLSRAEYFVQCMPHIRMCV